MFGCILGGVLFKLMLPGAPAQALRPLVWIAPLLLVVAKDLSHLPDALAGAAGARTHGSIARSAIAGCERVAVPAADWCRTRGIDPRAALVATPFDQPNTVMILAQGAGVRLQHLGRERTGLACVFLYLDRPERLAAALRQH